MNPRKLIHISFITTFQLTTYKQPFNFIVTDRDVILGEYNKFKLLNCVYIFF